MKITGLREKLGLPTDDGEAPDTFRHPQTQMALAMARASVVATPGRAGPLNLYAGTVPEHVTARRRVKNKQAARSRRINRGRR